MRRSMPKELSIAIIMMSFSGCATHSPQAAGPLLLNADSSDLSIAAATSTSDITVPSKVLLSYAKASRDCWFGDNFNHQEAMQGKWRWQFIRGGAFTAFTWPSLDFVSYWTAVPAPNGFNTPTPAHAPIRGTWHAEQELMVP